MRTSLLIATATMICVGVATGQTQRYTIAPEHFTYVEGCAYGVSIGLGEDGYKNGKKKSHLRLFEDAKELGPSRLTPASCCVGSLIRRASGRCRTMCTDRTRRASRCTRPSWLSSRLLRDVVTNDRFSKTRTIVGAVSAITQRSAVQFATNCMIRAAVPLLSLFVSELTRNRNLCEPGLRSASNRTVSG